MSCRLVNPVILRFERHDLTTVRSAGAYDDDARDFVLQTTGEGEGTTVLDAAVGTKLTYEVRAQLDVPTFEALNQTEGGNDPATSLVAYVTRDDLRRAGLLNPDESPGIGVNHRLVAVRSTNGGPWAPLTVEPTVTEVRPYAWACGRVRTWLVILGERSR